MNNKEFISELSYRTGFSAKDATEILNGFVSEISNFLEDENVLSIQGFGTFDVKKKLERVVVNPSTKQRMLVPPKMVINFKASPILKEKMQE